MHDRVNDIHLSTQYKEMEVVPPKGSSYADGTTGMDWLTPEGLQELIATSVAEVGRGHLYR